jgi:rhodanese-related sulfurtransferase
MEIQSISPETLQQMLQNNEPLMLVDVREPWEHDQYNIGGKLIPMQTLLANPEQIPTDTTVVLYCQKGIRSSIVIQRLQQKSSCKNLFNLSGGVDAWQQQIKKD